LGAEIRRIEAHRQFWQIVPETPMGKRIRAKCTECVAQAVECLFCKCKAPSPNLSPTKKKKRILWHPECQNAMVKKKKK
jgi:hypothetical protein